ncbi:CPBP family intramembrane metalloprotease [bacterium]|nr:CPBP family intramembrane metalloprotease [bacterium]MBU1754270.1 CPBP family intramembrane metalloprotease [bacterium]
MSTIKYKVLLIILFVSIFTTFNFTLVFAKGNDNNKEDAKFYDDLASSLSVKGKNDKAIKLCKKAIQLDPTNSTYYFSLGCEYKKIGLYEKAIQEYKKTIKIEPTNITTHMVLGDVYKTMNSYEDAIKEFKIVISIFDKKITEAGTATFGTGSYIFNKRSMPEKLQGKIYERLVEIYIKKGDITKAQEAKKKAQELQKEEDEYRKKIDKGLEVINRYHATRGYLLEVLLQYGSIILGFVILASFLQKKRRKKIVEIDFKIKWGIKDITLVFILFTFSPITILLFYYLAYPLKDIDINGYITTFTPDFLIILLVIFWIKGRYKQSFQEVGLKTSRWLKDVGIGLIVGAGLLILSIGIITLYVLIFDYIPKSFCGIGDDFSRAISFKSILFPFILFTLIAPFSEELFFRGFVYSSLRERIGIKWAIIISALFFASVYGTIFGFLPLFLVSIVSAWLYERRESLIPCIVAHITISFIWALLLYYEAEIKYLFIANQL